MKTYQDSDGNLNLVSNRSYRVLADLNKCSVFKQQGKTFTKIADTLPAETKVKLIQVRGYFSKKIVLFEILTGEFSGCHAVIHMVNLSDSLLKA